MATKSAFRRRKKAIAIHNAKSLYNSKEHCPKKIVKNIYLREFLIRNSKFSQDALHHFCSSLTFPDDQ
jgi:hypothetical protein